MGRATEGGTSTPLLAQRRRRKGVPAIAVGLLILVSALVGAIWLSLAVGTGPVGTDDVLSGVFGPDLTDKGQLILQEVRIPRTVAGLMAGVALGLAGAIMQGVARNPLADPGLLGINAGASAAVVFALSILGLSAPEQYVWFGFAGALVAALIVYGIGAIGRDGATPVKIALAGAAANAALLSLTTAMLLKDTRSYDQYRLWQVGSLTGRDTEVLWTALPFVAVGTLLALILSSQLNTLALGDDVARGLGQRTGLARAGAGAVVVLLCGIATVVAGPIAFVGLVVPHAVRLLAGPDHRRLLLFSALLAPTLLLLADVVGRVIAPPGEVQAGIVTAAIGAIPFVLLVRGRKTITT
ncbi:FecCD family ABC transporter permease [Streptomyces sp. NPDC004838]